MAKTGLLSPEQAARRATALEEQAKRLREEQMNYEFGEVSPNANPKDVSASKTLINVSFIVFGLCGIVGSFWDAFDMTKYVEFLKVFAYIWAPLVIAVAGGRQAKNYINKKYGDGSGDVSGAK
jgi:hypothetical protein